MGIAVRVIKEYYLELFKFDKQVFLTWQYIWDFYLKHQMQKPKYEPETIIKDWRIVFTKGMFFNLVFFIKVKIINKYFLEVTNYFGNGYIGFFSVPELDDYLPNRNTKNRQNLKFLVGCKLLRKDNPYRGI